MQFEIDRGGSGDVVVCLPGSYSTSRVWDAVIDAMEGQYRFVSLSLPGYGDTLERRDPDCPRVEDMIGFVYEIAECVGSPVHLVGHSFGGLVALAAALDGTTPIKSVVTFEANPIYVQPMSGTEFSWRTGLDAMVARFLAAVADGEQDAARIIIDYWSRPGTFAELPDPVRAYCRLVARTNVLDWQIAQDFTPTIDQFSELDMPTTICRGGLANEAIVEVSASLARALPRGVLKVVPGAGHFLVSTHPASCSRLIADHLSSATA